VSAVYAWLRRHPKLVDGGLAAALAFLGTASAAVMVFRPGSPAAGFGRLAAIPLALLLAVPVVFRRSHPVGAFAAAIVFGALQVLLDVRPNATDLAIVILLYSLAAYTPRRTSITGLAICLIGSAAAVARWMPDQLSVLEAVAVGSIMFAGPSLIAWVFGDSMRYRRAYYTSLEDRAARLEAERDAQAQIAAATERARIARELHDVVAHNVSVMVVQADGASYALGSDPDRARQALAAISATGRQALTEMRRMLGVLRRDEDGTEPERAPLPGIGQLGELLEQARAAGLAVSFTVEGVPQPLPDGAALAAYRIVQESLTNTRKHGGPRATAQVMLRYLEDALLLLITDDGRGAAAASDGAGHGLTGMRERVAVYGGWVQAGPRPAGGYQVTARLPLTPAPPTAAPASPAPAPPAPAPRGVLADTNRAGAA
jgi:signal transduction histidine kinase